MSKPNILIAFPAYGGNVKDGCTISLLKLQSVLLRNGIAPAFGRFSSANISLSRNLFASICLARPEISHLGFVDADTEFEPPSFLKMIEQDHPFVRCNYSKKKHPIEPATNGLGLCLFKREVFTRLYETGALRKQTGHGLEEFGLTGPLYGFFDQINGMSEDNSFHLRWRDIGGEIIALDNEPIGHVGDYVYRLPA